MRLIDADALCRRLWAVYRIAKGCGAQETAVFYKALLEEVKQMEMVDAVEVVRCKDCKFFHRYKDNGKFVGAYCDRFVGIYGMIPDGFCSEGEKDIKDD